MEMKVSHSETLWIRQALLRFGAKLLCRMESGASLGYHGNGGPKGSDWLSIALEADFQSAKAEWVKTDSEETYSRANPLDAVTLQAKNGEPNSLRYYSGKSSAFCFPQRSRIEVLAQAWHSQAQVT
jgi:hypothetical protein